MAQVIYRGGGDEVGGSRDLSDETWRRFVMDDSRRDLNHHLDEGGIFLFQFPEQSDCLD